jgi:hypothetical protein
MAIDVTPTSSEPTHHISLSDGTTTYGIKVCNNRGEPDPRAIRMGPINRQAFKISQGESKYGDLEFPYSTIIQQDWSGGRGAKEFETDTTKYWDAEGVNTMQAGKFFPGPEPIYAVGLRANESWFRPTDAVYQYCQFPSIKGKYQATPFVATASTTLSDLWLWVRCTKTAYSTFHIYLYSDNAGSPGSQLVATTLPNPTTYIEYDDQNKPFLVKVSLPYAVSSGATYWLAFYGAGSLSEAQDVMAGAWPGGGFMKTTLTPLAPDPWVVQVPDNQRYCFRYLPASEKSCTFLPFEYKGALYAVQSFDDNSTAVLWINGYAGVLDATGSTFTELHVNGTPFTAHYLIGCTVKITNGTGASQQVPYRTITENTNHTITVDPPFDVYMDATSEYVIIGYDGWYGVGATGSMPTKTITDVKVLNNAVYFCQNEYYVMVRFRAYNNAGTWTKVLAAETEKATYITQIMNEEGKTYIWLAKSIASTVSFRDSVDCTTGSPAALGAGTTIKIGSTGSKITGIEGYGEPLTPWIFKEDSLWNVSSKIPLEVPLSEMKTVSSENNGAAHCTQGVYLYFSLLNSVERFYKNNLDDLNPGRDGGLPTTPYNRNGIVRKMLSYPGKLFIAIDAGTSGQSSVMVWDGVAYHEYYRAPHGLRVRNIYIQSVPGVGSDKLWVSVGPDLIALDLALNPLAVSDYHYKHYGDITLAKMGTNMLDLTKFWKSVKLFTEDIATNYFAMFVDYKADDEAAWVVIGHIDTYGSTMVNEIIVQTLAKARVNSKIIQLRLRYENWYSPITPVILRAATIENIIFVPVKYSYGLTFVLQDEALDLNGDDDSYTAAETLSNKLIAWAKAGTILTLRSVWSWMDNIAVRIDPVSVMGLTVVPDDQMERNIASLTLSDA